MTTPDSPKTPRADYAPMGNGKQNLNTQPSLPILAAGGKQNSQDMWEPSSARSGDYVNVNDLQSVQSRSRDSSGCLPSPLRKLARSWMVLRWQLACNFFSVPLLFLTSMFDVMLGDLFITLPICAVFIVTTAMQAINDREVESSGNPPTYGLLIVFVFTVRNDSVLLALTGISYERVLFYHMIAALVTIILSGLHGLAYDKGEISSEGDVVFTGTVAFGAMVLMFVLSLGFVRRKFFEFFLRTHWILFIVVLVFAVMHGASTALIGVIPWGIDMAFRHAYRPRVYARGSIVGGKKSTSEDSPANVVTGKRMGVIASDQVSVAALPGKITRVSFPHVRKDTGEVFEFEAGQYAFLCIPSISKLQWHPFTISSAPHEDIVSFYIKASGDWTLKVFETAKKNDGAQFDILVDGPYGCVSVDIYSPEAYSHFALFASWHWRDSDAFHSQLAPL